MPRTGDYIPPSALIGKPYERRIPSDELLEYRVASQMFRAAEEATMLYEFACLERERAFSGKPLPASPEAQRIAVANLCDNIIAQPTYQAISAAKTVAEQRLDAAVNEIMDQASRDVADLAEMVEVIMTENLWNEDADYRQKFEELDGGKLPKLFAAIRSLAKAGGA